MVAALTGYRRHRRSLPLLAAAGVCGSLAAANAVAQGSVAMDRAALIALYDATGGQTWTDSTNWKTDAPLDEWHGVTTDAAGRVNWLSLSRNALTGPIPGDLGNLTNLRWLSLGGNELTGPIPANLGNLSNLVGLSLGGNELTGPIPDALGSLPSLESLFLFSNNLTGPIPASLGSLVNLEALFLGLNELTGPIPVALGSLPNLETLDLGFNKLTGPIPVAIGSLSNLESLDLAFNELTGPIPVALGNLSKLTSLLLRTNRLTGAIPAALGSLSSLETLSLGANELTGHIPVALGNLHNLEWLDLAVNELSGPVPAALGSLFHLRILSLGGNELTGPVPGWLGSLTNLELLFLLENSLTGPIPAALGNLSNLRSLSVGRNDLTGPVPAALGNLATLESLFLAGNGLTGPIPAALSGLSSLEAMYLGGNDLTGPIPSELTRLSRLKVLSIEDTGLCAPAESLFQEWLATIDVFSGSRCNRQPEPLGAIPAQTLDASSTAIGISVEGYFRDPDDDPLTFTATSSQADTVAASVSGSTVWLVPGDAGTATLTVTANDPGGLSATQALTVAVVASSGPQSDRAVLAALYDETSGPAWINSENWKTAAPLAEWHGVTTNGDGRVTTLTLVKNALAGPIPAALASLSALESLSLSGNALAGPIPDALSGLSELKFLDLGGNGLTGPIPVWLGSLSNLERLDLDENELAGPIPAALGNLSSLEWLNLRRNALIGPIPATLGSLSSLKWLILNGNALTGPIPAALGSLSSLRELNLSGNELTGPIPAALGNLSSLVGLSLGSNALTGPVPDALGSLSGLERLDLSYSWGVSGTLPDSLRLPSLRLLNVWVTQACAPIAWHDWMQTIEFTGAPCETETDVTIDVATLYTPAAREAAGGTTAIEAVIDLMIAETNEAYAASGVRHRVALVARSEVQYSETGDPIVDLGRLASPSDGHMDEVHGIRDTTGADLVHLLFDEGDEGNIGTIAQHGGPFGLTCQRCGAESFARATGHNMGLLNDRDSIHDAGGTLSAHPGYGYVNQRMFEPGATPSTRWTTIMARNGRCSGFYRGCPKLLRFANPRQTWLGDPLGVSFEVGGSGVNGPADTAAVLNATGPAVAAWRDRMPERANQPPAAVGALPDLRLPTLQGTLVVDVSAGFVDPDGDALSYTANSTAPAVVTVHSEDATVTLTAVGIGVAAVRVTVADPDSLTATQSFTVTVPPTIFDSPESDREALVALYDATGGLAWKNGTKWKSSEPLGEWHGVTTDSAGRVTGLSLASNELTGRLPADLGNLSYLRRLILNGNALTGPIPASLGDLSNLERLVLNRNGLAGPIPATLGSLSNLAWLDLAYNELTGAVPAWLGGLIDLQWLDLGSNELTGAVPGALRGLSSLQMLDLGYNELTGSVPAWLDNLSELRILSLSGNALVGSIPAALGRLPRLESLRLGQNALTGPIPSELGSLPNLRVLSLPGNALNGTVPPELGSLANLRSLDLARNDLSGPIPLELTQLSGLISLDIRYSGLCAPSESAYQVWLATIRVFFGTSCQDNRSPEPVGTISVGTLTARGLALGVSVAGNFRDPDNDRLIYTATSSQAETVAASISGSVLWLVPRAAGMATLTVKARDSGGLSAIQMVTLTVGSRSGPQGDYAVLAALYDGTGGPDWMNSANWKTPAPLGEWHGVTTDAAGRVTGLDLDFNGLTGPLPEALANLSNLESLHLAGNALTGPIPAGLGSLHKLESLGLAFNALTGSIPQALSSLSYLDSPSSSGIGRTAQVPVYFGELSRLESLDLAGNSLTGPIPGALASLLNLKSLDLGLNDLTGPIPGALGALSSLESLDLGFNDLTGPIPQTLGSLSQLNSLDLRFNDLTGPIPSRLGSLSRLERLDLGRNALTGPIPESLGSLSGLESLDLRSNDLTGPIPSTLGSLSRLEQLDLGRNALNGPIPESLGSLSSLQALDLRSNELSGPVPDTLGNLSELESLSIRGSWGVSGPLPSGLHLSRLRSLDAWLTQACVPVAWQDWVQTIEFSGATCTEEAAIVDVAVFYTPAAREAAGGIAAIEAVIDLMIAETNEAYVASGVRHRVALVARSEVQYEETGDSALDLSRLVDLSDGHMDEVHATRERTGADLVHLLFDEGTVGGIARLGGAFGLSCQRCGGSTFAHELGHNMGLRHDRHQESEAGMTLLPDPAYGYVNQRAFDEGAVPSGFWRTIMAYDRQCAEAGTSCHWLLRFSNPRQTWLDDPLGVSFNGGASGVNGPADAAAVLNKTAPAVAAWRDRPPSDANQPQAAAGARR